MNLHRILGPLALALLASGCYAGVEGRANASYDVVTVPPPVRVEAYPYVVYDGAPVYYVEGRWYRRHGNGWVYYRSEPGYLSSHRPVVVAPPAYGPRRGPVITAPPAYPARPARPSAPPAHHRR